MVIMIGGIGPATWLQLVLNPLRFTHYVLLFLYG
jgi:hypothetical protein